MPSYNDAFPSKYLSAPDLKGEDHVVVIVRYSLETMQGDSSDQKYVLYFQNHKKGMVLNKTNAKTITAQHGPDFDGWIGRAITIGTAWVEAFGEQTLAIRVRPAIPQAVAAPETPTGEAPFTDENVTKDLNDDIGF